VIVSTLIHQMLSVKSLDDTNTRMSDLLQS